MVFDVNAQSHVGLVRKGNEDMILVDSLMIRDESYTIRFEQKHDERSIYAIADGMGGHNAGEIASEETLKDLLLFFRNLPSGLTLYEFIMAFKRWIIHIKDHINGMGEENLVCQGMGTTLVGICCYETRFYWFNCGDSRLYRFRNGELLQLSEDHSYERLTGLKGYSNVITNCIGANCSDVFLDIHELTDIQPEDRFILCSDGLTDMVEDSQIERFLRVGSTSGQLVKLAIREGGRDNVSVCMVKVSDF